MDSIAQLIRAADRYGAELGLETTTVSWRIFGDSKKLDALRGGRDIQMRRFQSAMNWLSENWPQGVAWPAGVHRPHSSASQASDAAPVAPAAELGALEKSGASQ